MEQTSNCDFEFKHQKLAERILWSGLCHLSEREISFLEHLIDSNHFLSVKQRALLDNIHQRYEGACEILQQVSKHS